MRHMGSSQKRDGTCVSCIGKQILIHCTTREVLALVSYFVVLFLNWLYLSSDVIVGLFNTYIFQKSEKVELLKSPTITSDDR